MKNAFLKYYPFLPLLLLCGFYTFQAVGFPIHDFANYYFGGKFLADGHFNSDIYFPYEFNKAISDMGNPNIFVSYAPNTPFLAVCFLPFAFLAVAKAKLLFNCLTVVLFVISIARLSSHYKLNPKFVLLIPILFLVPIKNNLLFGQVYFLLFFLLAEGWLAYEKRQWKSMAFFWGLSILLKVFPVLLVALLLFRKQWKPLLYLTVSCGLFFGISILFTGFDIWIFYLKEVLPKASNGEIATGFVDNYQSVFMFLKEMLVFDASENPTAFFNFPVIFAALIVAFKMGVLAVGYFISKRVSNWVMVFSYWIMATIILSPYGSTYTFILLLFVFLALLKSDIPNVKKVIFCSILFLISNMPLALFIENPFPWSYLRLFGLLLFFGLFIFVLRKHVNWKMTALFLVIPMALVLVLQNPKIEKSTVLLKNSPILIYDYEIKGNQLTYFYWTEKGENKASISLNDTKIGDKTMIYLSDYGRGIGFYTLRKIHIH